MAIADIAGGITDELQNQIKQRIAAQMLNAKMQQEGQRLRIEQQTADQTGAYQRSEVRARQDATKAAQAEHERATLAKNQQAFDSAQYIASPSTPQSARVAAQYRNATGENIPGEALKATEPPKPNQPVIQIGRSGQLKNLGDAPANAHFEIEPAPKEPKDTSAGDASRLDRSYAYHATALDKLRKPYDDISQRLTKLHDTLAQGTPQADALVAPELMTVMAGGMGSGLRLNEAEISRVVGGRSKWQNLQAAANQWATDPSKANSITPEQRQQIHALVQLTEDRVRQAHTTLDEAGDSLVNATDVNAHRQILNTTRKKLTGLVSGPDTAGGGTTAGQPKAGDTKVFPNGRKAVYDGTGWVAQ